MWPWLVFSVFFYTLLIYAWVVGLRAVQRYQPEKAVTYYFIMASIRFVMALTVVALYMLFSRHTHEKAVTFCRQVKDPASNLSRISVWGSQQSFDFILCSADCQT